MISIMDFYQKFPTGVISLTEVVGAVSFVVYMIKKNQNAEIEEAIEVSNTKPSGIIPIIPATVDKTDSEYV